LSERRGCCHSAVSDSPKVGSRVSLNNNHKDLCYGQDSAQDDSPDSMSFTQLALQTAVAILGTAPALQPAEQASLEECASHG
jgi:hypothetical protein